MTSPLPPQRSPFRPERIVAALLAVAIVAVVCAGMVEDASLPERTDAMRLWGFIAAGLCAIVIPHILFPDARLHLVQIVNPAPSALYRYQAWRLRWLAAGLAFTYLIFTFYDPADMTGNLGAKSMLLAEGLLFLAGVLWYALGSYGPIGERSQQWSEGTRGNFYRALNQGMPLFLVPVGLVPSMLATGRITAFGAVAIIISANLSQGADLWLYWLAGPLLMLPVLLRLPRLLRRYDRHFYQTNAFYDEAYRMAGGGIQGELRRLPYDATYWVPSRWRPHVWGSLTQLDRRLPMGRVIIPALLLFWALHLRETGEGVLDTFLALLLLVKNSALYLTVTDRFAPRQFQAMMAPPGEWIATRFFMNMKWTFPLASALIVVALFSSEHGAGYMLGWTGLDLLLAFASALILTYLHEFQFQKQYT